MRDIYYQPVGNPLQLDRLPRSRPQIQMLPPVTPVSKQVSRAMLHLVAGAVAGLTTFILYRPPGRDWLEPYDLLLAGPIFIAGIAVWAFTGKPQWLLHPLLLTAVVLLCVNHRIPWLVQIVLISVVAGLLVYAFGRHWTAVCTAIPSRTRPPRTSE